MKKTWPRISQRWSEFSGRCPGDVREVTIYTGYSPPDNSSDRLKDRRRLVFHLLSRLEIFTNLFGSF